ncbi:MAG: hypothetical protein ACSHW4_11925 [Cellulophaga sp.]
MSQITEYIYIKNLSEQNAMEVLSKLITDSKFEYVSKVDLCSTNKANDFYIGEINNGTIIFGGDYFYELFWNEESEIRKNLIDNFKSHEIIAIEYNDQVMTIGYIIIKNGLLKRVAEIGEEELNFGELNMIEKNVRKNLADEDKISETEVSYDSIVSHSFIDLEKYYLKINLENLKCSDLSLEQYRAK